MPVGEAGHDLAVGRHQCGEAGKLFVTRAPGLRRERDRHAVATGVAHGIGEPATFPPLESGPETGLVGAAAGESGRSAEEDDPGTGRCWLRERVVDGSLGADRQHPEGHRAEVDERGLVTGRESVLSVTQVTFAVGTDEAAALRVDLRDEVPPGRCARRSRTVRLPAVGRPSQRGDRVVVVRDRIDRMGSRFNRPGE